MAIPGGTFIGTIVVGEKLVGDERGDLYHARQPGLDRRVLLRVLHRDLAEDSAVAERFRREAWLAARIVHPNVIQAFDYFELRDDQYLVLEFVDGITLRDAIDRARAADLAETDSKTIARIGLEVARGLEEIHLHGVVHNDLRAEHLMLSRWGEIKIKGLGSAHAVSEIDEPEGRAARSGAHVAPEVAVGLTPTAAADVYSLGTLLDELCGGLATSGGAASRSLRHLIRACRRESPSERPSLTTVLARLQKICGPTGTADARAEIAAWVWRVRVLSHAEMSLPMPSEAAASAAAPEDSPSERGARRSRRAARASRRQSGRSIGRAGVPLALAGGLLLAFATWLLQSEPSIEPVSAAAPTPAVAAAPIPLATLQVSIYPWAEVEVSGQPRFYTPRAEPLELKAGRYEIVLRHPSHGVVSRVVELDSGEKRVFRHAFSAREALP